MNNKIRFFVFVFPILIVILFFFPEGGEHINFRGICIFVLSLLYPIICNLFFFKNKLLIWSAPLTNLLLALICIVWLFVTSGSPEYWGILGMLPYFILASLGWSIACTLGALLLKYIVKKTKNKNSL